MCKEHKIKIETKKLNKRLTYDLLKHRYLANDTPICIQFYLMLASIRKIVLSTKTILFYYSFNGYKQNTDLILYEPKQAKV